MYLRVLTHPSLSRPHPVSLSDPVSTISAATFAAEVILKIAAAFLRSIFMTVNVYFITMGVLPFRADASFQE